MLAVCFFFFQYSINDFKNKTKKKKNQKIIQTTYTPQEPDETLAERLWGLTEMFPEGVRTACDVITDFSISSTKNLYKFSCNASWIFFTSSMILFAPVLFETERAQMAELEMSQKQRVSCILHHIIL